jgi:hypothetical protein
VVREVETLDSNPGFNFPGDDAVMHNRIVRQELEQPALARLGSCAASCQRRARDSLKPRSCKVNGLFKPSAWRFDRRSPPRPSRSPVSAMRSSHYVHRVLPLACFHWLNSPNASCLCS